MVGQLSVGQHTHYQNYVEPGFPAGTFNYIPFELFIKNCQRESVHIKIITIV